MRVDNDNALGDNNKSPSIVVLREGNNVQKKKKNNKIENQRIANHYVYLTSKRIRSCMQIRSI